MAKARAKPKTQLSRREREKRALVARIIVILRRGEPSRFRFEAACRHGLRIAWTWRGVSWAVADAAAAEIVALALHRMGVARPSDAEAGGEIVEPARGAVAFCRTCGGPLELGEQAFCSAICARIGYAKRRRYDRTDVAVVAHAEKLAGLHAAIAKRRMAVCAHCGKNFERRLTKHSQKFCSMSCQYASRKKPRFRLSCRFCGSEFEAYSTRTRYCSGACKAGAHRARKAAAE